MDHLQLFNGDALKSVSDGTSNATLEVNKGKSALLAIKIEKQMRRKGLSKQQFASLMDVQPSIISRWLSGSHNFTINTLFEIEQKLKVRLIDLGANEPSGHVTFVQLKLSIDSQTTEIFNTGELIDVVNGLYQFGEPQNTLIPTLPTNNYCTILRNGWQFKAEL